MEHRLHQFHFVYWVQKFVHVDWLSRVNFLDFLDRLIWECAGDRLISECAEYHVGTFVVGSNGTREAVGLALVSHRAHGGHGGNWVASDFTSDFMLPTSSGRHYLAPTTEEVLLFLCSYGA